ncbi:hypothetical protein ACIQ48_20905 [Bacillus mycoides]|uniref:hypothetical protein n=1 Tax=Bacillus mycoides TaxID=1405 RepID=UPI00382C8408
MQLMWHETIFKKLITHLIVGYEKVKLSLIVLILVAKEYYKVHDKPIRIEQTKLWKKRRMDCKYRIP